MRRWRRPLGTAAAVGVAVALASVGLLVVASPAGAVTVTASPDPTVDGAAGSLRAAVGAATDPAGDEIDLAAGGTYTLTACGSFGSGLGQLFHGGSTNLIIRTPSGPPATIRQTCSGERVLQQGSGLLTLDNVIVTGGNLQQFLGNTGGGIDAQGGVTVMNNSRVTGNSITAIVAQGGAIHAAGVTVTNSTIDHNAANGNTSAGGAINTLGGVTVTDSTVSNNTANGFVAAQGGAIDAFSGVTVTRSTMSDNTAVSNGNSIGGAFNSGVGAATITDSTLSGNKADARPCCMSTIAQGGAFRANRAVTVTNSTLSGNSATAGNGARGGAIFAFGLTPPSTVTVTNSTIASNTATNLGGGIWTDNSLITVYSTVVSNSAPTGANVNLNGTGTLTSFATVIALPQGGGANCASLAGTTSNGFNLEDDAGASCGFATATADLAPGTAPSVGALTNNGGPTQTQLPQPASALIDAIPNASCQAGGASGIVTDQRGLPRPGAGNPACDIGAVEVQPPPVPNPPTAVLVAPAGIAPRFTG